jgi:hypothetical protein
MFLTDPLVSGQQVPYPDLCRRLGMSQTPVIMAWVRLENIEKSGSANVSMEIRRKKLFPRR